jgi:hypothetical protein
MAVPNTFATDTGSIPLADLDANFSYYDTAYSIVSTAVTFNGVVSYPDGTAALPSITNTGDTNTGIFFPAVDTIAFSEGGAEAMRINSSGNVGIGTSSPAVRLDVNGITGWQGGTTGIAGSIVGASSGINNGGNLRVLANTTQAANVGGALTFGGYYTSTTLSVDFGAILGAKENSTGGDTAGYLAFGTRPAGGNMTERMRIDSAGNVQLQTGAVMPYAPAPTAISAATTLTNANIQAQIISATGTTYTITMPLGTTLETLATWVTTGIAYDFFVINTASGTITMAVNTGVTSLGGLTIATGVSAQFRIRRTAANTFVMYRLS